jgi:hypothetical protein
LASAESLSNQSRPEGPRDPSDKSATLPRTRGEYLAFAEECRRLATRAGSLEERALLLEMANTWLSLADPNGRPGTSLADGR